MLKLRKILLCNYLYIILTILVFIITIYRINIPKQSNYCNNSTQFIGIVTKIVVKDNKVTMYIKNKETIIAYYYINSKKEDINNISLGDKIKVTGTFILPNNNKTDYTFNYKEYLYRNNIFYLVKISSLQKLKTNKNIYYFLKQKIILLINNNPYLYTFILGDKTYIDNSVKRSFQENGISHLFAISGMHITLLVNLIKRILHILKLNEDKVFKITMFILIIYLFLVGLSPSILRGVLFYLLFSLNNIYYFYIKPINLFFSILSISLIINPNFLFDIGYLYSYSISFALIILNKKLNSTNYFLTLLKVSFVSFIVSIPITIYNFYQLNILSIIYNLLFVPLISYIIFPVSLLFVIIKPLEPIYDILINILEGLSLALINVSVGKIVFKKLPLIFYFIYFSIILLWIYRTKNIYIYILIILLVLHYFIPYIKSDYYIEAMDVGQGDSILFHYNKKNILIDTGGIESYNKNNTTQNYFYIISPSLKSKGISKIDYLILTHGDFDHMGEAINLIENFKVEKVIFNCGEFNDLEKELIKVLDKKKIQYYSCIKELNTGNNKLYFLQTKEYDNENDNSNVIYTELNGYKFMFMGDASIATEKEILDKYNLPDIDVLKVGHHGSKTSSSKEFINEINPKYSIISVGKNNRYGHPNKEVLNTLDKSKIYRTDQDGSIMFKIKNKKLKIETCSP